MTVSELIELLADQDLGAEVRFAWQPSWPMESAVSSRVVGLKDEREDATAVVYLAEEENLGYLPGVISESLGWR